MLSAGRRGETTDLIVNEVGTVIDQMALEIEELARGMPSI